MTFPLGRSIKHPPIAKYTTSASTPPATVPPPVLDALGLGLGYNLSLQRKDENPIDFDRLRKDIRNRYTFQDEPPRKLKSPKLYVKNSNWDPDEAHAKIEKAITQFEKATADAFLDYRRLKYDYNLNPATLQTLRDIRLSKRFCVTATDKNLGPAILEMDQYIERTEISTRTAAELDLANNRRILKLTVDDRCMDKDSIEYFTKKLCGPHSDNGVTQMPEHLRLPYFYLIPKIHKTPWKTRSVVSGFSTVNKSLSKWIDIQLQQVIHLCPAYLKDS
jgi:hypothetical protein